MGVQCKARLECPRPAYRQCKARVECPRPAYRQCKALLVYFICLVTEAIVE